MTIDITTLPKEIQKRLPLSIRTFSTTYELEQLPIRIQHLIRNYYSTLPDIQYNVLFDFAPEASEYGDFKGFTNVVDLVVEYLKNYFNILPGAYPFDPTFGCTLKNHLQMRDTATRQTLVAAEIGRIIDLIRTLLDVNIYVQSIDIQPTSVGAYTEFNVNINLIINEVHKKLNMEFR